MLVLLCTKKLDDNHVGNALSAVSLQSCWAETGSKEVHSRNKGILLKKGSEIS